MKLKDIILEYEYIQLEKEAELILNEFQEDFVKATSKNPHPSLVNAWSKRDGIDPKKAMKLWDEIWKKSKIKKIEYVIPHYVNAYKTIKGTHAGKVKTRTKYKTKTHKKQSIDTAISNAKE